MLDYSKLCQKGLEIDPQIRFAGILDKDGCLVYGIHKDGVKSLLDDDEVKCLFTIPFKDGKISKILNTK